MRLARFLAHGGVASRRASERLIADGRVRVGGSVVTDPALDVDETSAVEVDGVPVAAEPREVWLLNKPSGVVSTASEPGSRRAVVELVPSSLRLYPVGRLDAESTGLILLTNDGELANRLMHPRYEIPRTYRIRFAKPISDESITRLATGVELEDGLTLPAKARRVSPRVVELTLREGRNRQVRRMGEAVGNRVDELRRIRFAGLSLGDLGEGRARKLKATEVERLWQDRRSPKR
ncbi:rRNA pseudouridine synthase [Thermoleophilia bacterium SCSIO 60948]|nr:rRNA pseudouridine synthase [Thermoleophilia bacterium SCSIO 60948]